MLFLGAVITLSNAAGIGGGGLIIPVELIFFKFSPTSSVALSNTGIFVAGLARFITNFSQRHPLRSSSVAINYEMVILMFPVSKMGALIGTQVNYAFPPSVILILLTIALLILGYKCLEQAV